MKREQFCALHTCGSGRTDHRILKEAEAGAVVTELCCKHGMSSATYYSRNARRFDPKGGVASDLRSKK